MTDSSTSSTSEPTADVSSAAAPTPRSIGKKIVQVSTVHSAGDVRIFTKQCRTLADAGYGVTLYARADEPREEGGVRVVPLRTRSRLLRMTVGVWGLLRALLAENADVYHLHDPELVPLGAALRAMRRTVVFDAHEDLPAQVLEKNWIPQLLRPAVARASRALIALAGRSMSAIVAATPTIAERFHGTVVKVVANYPVVHETDQLPYAERSRASVYVGAISEVRGFSVMVEAARRVHAKTGTKLTLVGPFQPASLENRLNDAEVEKVVDYLGVFPPEQARRVMAESKAGLLLYRRSRAHEDAMPNKMFEYMAAGVPVVGSDFPLWRGIIQETGAGIVVPPDDAEVVADAVLEILEDEDSGEQMGDNGRDAVTDRFSWDAEASTLLGLYGQLTGGNR